MNKNKNFIDRLLNDGALGTMNHSLSAMTIVGMAIAAIGTAVVILLIQKTFFK